MTERTTLDILTLRACSGGTLVVVTLTYVSTPLYMNSKTKSLNTHGLPQCLHLVLSDECDHRVGGNSEVVRGEAGPQAEDATHLHLLHGTIDWSLEGHLTSHGVRLHLLDLRLHEIKWQTEGRGCESSNGTGAKDLQAGRGTNGLQALLGLSVESEHAKIQRHGSRGCGHGSLEKSERALIGGYRGKGVSNTSVVPPLCLRQHAVRLHSNQSQIRRVACYRCNATCTESTDRLLQESRNCIVRLVLGHVCEDVEETQASPV